MVKNILGMIAGGYELGKVLETYPELICEMVEAALQTWGYPKQAVL